MRSFLAKNPEDLFMVKGMANALIGIIDSRSKGIYITLSSGLNDVVLSNIDKLRSSGLKLGEGESDSKILELLTNVTSNITTPLVKGDSNIYANCK